MADKKITELTELDATPNDADILAIVDDVAGTPVTKKITAGNLRGGLTAEANLQPPGPVTFAGSTGHTITHNYGHTDYQLIINPVADPGGFLGEIWISKALNTAVVYNSGSATGNFDYVIIPAA